MKFITIKAACRLGGGEDSPIHAATYYRGVKAGLYARPVHVSPNVARVEEGELRQALARRLSQPQAA
jgi:hypothetical protein